MVKRRAETMAMFSDLQLDADIGEDLRRFRRRQYQQRVSTLADFVSIAEGNAMMPVDRCMTLIGLCF